MYRNRKKDGNQRWRRLVVKGTKRIRFGGDLLSTAWTGPVSMRGLSSKLSSRDYESLTGPCTYTFRPSTESIISNIVSVVAQLCNAKLIRLFERVIPLKFHDIISYVSRCTKKRKKEKKRIFVRKDENSRSTGFRVKSRSLLVSIRAECLPFST